MILISEEKDLSKRKPSLHRVDEVERAAHLGTSFFMIMIIIILLKSKTPASKLQLTAEHCLNFLKHSSFNFEPHPRMLFQRLTDAKNSRDPEHVVVKGNQHLTIFNFDFKHMTWIMNQHLKTPRHVMVWGDQYLIFSSCILFTWYEIRRSRTWKTQTWAKKCPTMALPKLSNQWSW